MVGFGLGDIPQMGKIISIAEKAVNAFSKLMSSTDCMERWEREGVIPARFSVYDYEVTFVIEDKRKRSLDADVVEVKE